MVINREFIQDVIDKVRQIPTSDIVEDDLGPLKVRSGLKKGLCPFHNDRHIGSFVVCDRKGIFKCFSCGTAGDGIKYVALRKGINYVESAMWIAERFGIISIEEYEAFTKRKYSNEKARKIEKVYIEKDKNKFIVVIAPADVLNNVYTAFIKESNLSEEHTKYLEEDRDFKEEDIVSGEYFTFPARTITRGFIKRLKEDYGYDPEILKDVPGFYYDKTTKSWTFTKNKGLGIAIKNAEGQIVGIQIRRDKADEGKSRYIWFSSAFIEYDEALAEKYEHGTSSGSPIDVVYPKVLTIGCIIITEGRFKAKKLAETYGCVAISVQGVGSWRNIVDQVKTIKRRCPQKSFKNMYVAFDADMAYNFAVFTQAMNMTNKLKSELENEINISYNMWSTDFGKGIDDLINNGHKGKVLLMKKDEFDCLYKGFMKDMEERYIPKYNEIKNIPKELLKEHFEEDILPKFDEYDKRYAERYIPLA